MSKGLVILFVLVGIPVQAAEPSALESSIETLTIEAKIPRKGDFLGFGFGSLWMMSDAGLVRVDPADNSVTHIEIPENNGLFRGIGVGENAVWIPDIIGDVVYKVDPAANKVIQSITAQMTGSEGSIGVGEGAIWVVGGRTLWRVNAETGRLISKSNGLLEERDILIRLVFVSDEQLLASFGVRREFQGWE